MSDTIDRTLMSVSSTCQATSWGAGTQGHPGHHCVTMGGCEPQAGEPLGGCQPQPGGGWGWCTTKLCGGWPPPGYLGSCAPHVSAH